MHWIKLCHDQLISVDSTCRHRKVLLAPLCSAFAGDETAVWSDVTTNRWQNSKAGGSPATPHPLAVSSRHKWKLEKNYSASYRNPETSHSIRLPPQREVDQNYECLKICPINQAYQNKVGVIDPSGALANMNCENHTDIFGTMWLQTHLFQTRHKPHLDFPAVPRASKSFGMWSCLSALCWGHTSRQPRGWFCNVSKQLYYTQGVSRWILLTEP